MVCNLKLARCPVHAMLPCDIPGCRSRLLAQCLLASLAAACLCTCMSTQEHPFDCVVPHSACWLTAARWQAAAAMYRAAMSDGHVTLHPLDASAAPNAQMQNGGSYALCKPHQQRGEGTCSPNAALELYHHLLKKGRRLACTPC